MLTHSPMSSRKQILRFFSQVDARNIQIGSLGILLAFGMVYREFSLSTNGILSVLAGGIAAQLIGIWTHDLPISSLKSALISVLGVALLARSTSPGILGLVGFVAVLSKFVFRYRGKHFFNPTNFGLILGLLLTGRVWVSPAQWGEDVILAAWVLCAGGAVVTSAVRWDISLIFLSAHLFLLGGRVWYLGQPSTVFLHQIASGSLLIFTFFMISDPRSTPNHRIARMVFALLVAIVAFVIRFNYYNSQGLLWALFFLSPTTLLLDAIWKSGRFEWKNSEKLNAQTSCSNPLPNP